MNRNISKERKNTTKVSPEFLSRKAFPWGRPSCRFLASKRQRWESIEHAFPPLRT